MPAKKLTVKKGALEVLQSINVEPQKIELSIKNPDLEEQISKILKLVFKYADHEKMTPSATSEQQFELDERRLKLEEDRHELDREQFEQRCKEWNAQEARYKRQARGEED